MFIDIPLELSFGTSVLLPFLGTGWIFALFHVLGNFFLFFQLLSRIFNTSEVFVF
jgi:hypothetical protein